MCELRHGRGEGCYDHVRGGRDKCSFCPECVLFLPGCISLHFLAFLCIIGYNMCLPCVCILLEVHLCSFTCIQVHILYIHFGKLHLQRISFHVYSFSIVTLLLTAFVCIVSAFDSHCILSMFHYECI